VPVQDEAAGKPSELTLVKRILEAAREADSRKILDQERRLTEIESERGLARDKITMLESALSETKTRLEKTDRQIEELQASAVEQAKQLETSLSDASNRLESTDKHVRELEERLVNERRDYLNTLQDMQGRFRKQDVRMNWSILGVGCAVLLGTAAGAVLIRDVQQNTVLLSGMSKDIKGLTFSMNGLTSMQHRWQDEQRRQAMPAAAPDAEKAFDATPAGSPAAGARPEPPENPAGSQSDATVNFSHNAPATDLTANREDMQPSSLQEAQAFFEKNADVEGVVSLPGGIQYRVVSAGSGQPPSLSDKVMLAYVGVRLDGTIFDETAANGGPLTLGMTGVQPGWQEVLLKMEEGAEFELYLPPQPATGGEGVSGSEASIYLIELLEVITQGETDPAAPAN
jgi:FKBP-type peptidyl-prolyl cis-trans isomerase